MGKQKLSAKAAKAKAIRDLAAANTTDRKNKRAHSQKERRKKPCPAGMDYDHKRQKCVSIKSNRGNEGEGTKKEGKKKYNTK